MTMDDLGVFVKAYCECALWCSHDINSDDETGDETFEAMNYDADDFSKEAAVEMREDCKDFIEANVTLLAELDAEQCGHDFWLTRNRHGAGFWDRGLGKIGDELTKAAHVYGSVDLYLNDQDTITIYG